MNGSPNLLGFGDRIERKSERDADYLTSVILFVSLYSPDSKRYR